MHATAVVPLPIKGSKTKWLWLEELLITISNNLVIVEVYDQNGIRRDHLLGTDFRVEENNPTIDLELCLNDKRVLENFRIRRFSFK